MFTIDASVHVNAVHLNEVGSVQSRLFLRQVRQQNSLIFAPTLLLVELAGTLARSLNDTTKAIVLAQALYQLPGIRWELLNNKLANEASRFAATYRLRGADAVYAAVAHKYDTTLVTWDKQQLQRLAGIIKVKRPSEVF